MSWLTPENINTVLASRLTTVLHRQCMQSGWPPHIFSHIKVEVADDQVLLRISDRAGDYRKVLDVEHGFDGSDTGSPSTNVIHRFSNRLPKIMDMILEDAMAARG